MEKIRVMVNGLLDKIGSGSARNVIARHDLELIPLSVTGFSWESESLATGYPVDSMKIDQKSIKLISPEKVAESFISDQLINYGHPDVVVCAKNSLFLDFIPEDLAIKTAFIFFVDDVEFETKRLKRDLKNLKTNFVVLSEDPDEFTIIEAIYFLYKQQIQNCFGNVFGEEQFKKKEVK